MAQAMRTRRILPLIFGVIALGFQTAQTQEILENSALVLPLRVGPGLTPDEEDIPFAVQNVIENMLLVNGGLKPNAAMWRYQELFSRREDLEDWVRVQTSAPRLEKLKSRYIIQGQVKRENGRLLVLLGLWDRSSGKRASQGLELDLPGLLTFRSGIIEVLEQIGINDTSLQRSAMLWKEELTLQALALLGEGVRKDSIAEYPGAPLRERRSFELGIKLCPQSYLLRNGLGWVQYREKDYASATTSFQQALQSNPDGIAALDGTVATGGGLSALERAVVRKAELRGESPSKELGALWHQHAVEAMNDRQYDTAIVFFDKALVARRDARDLQGQKITLFQFGSVYYELHQYDKAIPRYEQILPVARELNNRSDEAAVFVMLGLMYSNLHQFDKAVGNYEQGLRIAREVNDRQNEATALNGLGDTYREWKRYEDANRYEEQALALARERKVRSDEASMLESLGINSIELYQYEKAIGLIKQALPIYHELKYRKEEARSLFFLGDAYDALGQDEKAIDYVDQSLSIRRELKDTEGEAIALRGLGTAYNGLSQHETALSYCGQALVKVRELKDRLQEARILMCLASAHLGFSQYESAIGYLEQALAILPEPRDDEIAANLLDRLGSSYFGLNENEKAIGYHERALSINREIRNRPGEAESLHGLGNAYGHLSQYEKAVGFFEEALAIDREVKNRFGEGRILNSLGLEYGKLRKDEKGIGYLEQALVISREVKDRDGEGSALHNLGFAYDGLGQQEKGIGYHEQSMAILREIKDRHGEASALQGLGSSYYLLSQYEKAISYYEQSLAIRREIKDRRGEASSLNNLGSADRLLSHYQQALDYHEQALAISREVKSRNNEADSLNRIGMVYSHLGQYEKAISYYEQALVIFSEVKDRAGEGGALNNLGTAYDSLGQYEKAISYYERAIHEPEDRDSEAAQLDNLGVVYGNLGQYQKAIHYHEQALGISREVKYPLSEGIALNNLGSAYDHLAQYDRAISYHEQALVMLHEIRARESEAWALDGLMSAWRGSGKPQLAIFYGQHAVKTFQEIRGDNRGLGKELRQGYAQNRRGTYRMLAELLVAEGRLAEAQQVLDQLKDEEFVEFVQRDSSLGTGKSEIPLTPKESEWENRYRGISDRITAIGAERGILLAKRSRSAAEDQELSRLEGDLAISGKAFQVFLDGLAKDFGESHEADEKVFELRESQGLESTLRELGAGTVAIYTLITEKGYRAILTTADVQKGFEYPIAAADLSRKVIEFRNALQDPQTDPMPLAQELYRILVGPMAKDLEQAKARTLMWSLDGELRYLPVAALHDGEEYLVEKYRNVVFTPASQARLKDEPQADWRVLGLGVSKSYEGFASLPDVPVELRAIIREGRRPGGVLAGTIELNEAFTWEAMRTALRQHYPVVHIASHFIFRPGSDADSFLLLGDGSRLTLDQIRSLPQIFENVDLLTLSACNTAVGSRGDGREVEGFAVLAQRQGAKSVIATLWPVADQSTSLLMEKFYRLRAAKPGMDKAEALNRAQLALLRGERTTSDHPLPENRRAPYAHPFFWAPFILIGNWR